MTDMHFIPSEQVLKEVRAKLVLQGKSLSLFCREHRLVRQNVTAALTGQWVGPKASDLAVKVLALVEKV